MDRDSYSYTTIYGCAKSLKIARVENDSCMVIQWFGENLVKLNTDRCHLLLLGRNSNRQVTDNIGALS